MYQCGEQDQADIPNIPAVLVNPRYSMLYNWGRWRLLGRLERSYSSPHSPLERSVHESGLFGIGQTYLENIECVHFCDIGRRGLDIGHVDQQCHCSIREDCVADND